MRYVILACLALAGCGAPDASTDTIGPYPAAYKDIVSQRIKAAFFDPYSLRSVELSPPVAWSFGLNHGWLVCLKANAKNRMGGYAGIQASGYLIHRDGSVDDLAGQEPCTDAKYQPWTEMDSGTPQAAK